MRPSDLYSSREEARPLSKQRSDFQRLRSRLARITLEMEDHEPVYINGETFRAWEIRFFLTCASEPRS